MPALAFRLDRIDAVSSTTELGRNLGLQESPALVVAAAAETQRTAVLIIDQLDSISTTTAWHSANWSISTIWISIWPTTHSGGTQQVRL